MRSSLRACAASTCAASTGLRRRILQFSSICRILEGESPDVVSPPFSQAQLRADGLYICGGKIGASLELRRLLPRLGERGLKLLDLGFIRRTLDLEQNRPGLHQHVRLDIDLGDLAGHVRRHLDDAPNDGNPSEGVRWLRRPRKTARMPIPSSAVTTRHGQFQGNNLNPKNTSHASNVWQRDDHHGACPILKAATAVCTAVPQPGERRFSRGTPAVSICCRATSQAAQKTLRAPQSSRSLTHLLAIVPIASGSRRIRPKPTHVRRWRHGTELTAIIVPSVIPAMTVP